MEKFNTVCPHCQGNLEVQTDWIGMELECPLCSASFILQETTDTPAEKACPFCGNMIKYQATRCKFCKQAIPSLQQSNDEQQSSKAAGKQKCKFAKKKIGIIIPTSTAILAGILLTLGLKYYGVNDSAKDKLRVAKLFLDPDYDSSEKECEREIKNIIAFYGSNEIFLSQENRNNIQEMIGELRDRCYVFRVNDSAKDKLRDAKLILEPDYNSSEEECQRELKNITAFYDRNKIFLSKENRNNIQETIEKLKIRCYYFEVNNIAKAKLEIVAKLILDPDSDSSEEKCQREIENITAFYDSNAKFLSKENRNNIQETIKKLKIRKKEVAKIPSRQAVAQLRFDNSTYKTNIFIRKKINLKNSCYLLIFPVERKAHAQMIYDKIEQIGKSVKAMKSHMEEAKKCRERADKINVTGIDSYNQSDNLLTQAREHLKKAQNAILQAKRYHDEVKNLLLQETLTSMKQVMAKERDNIVWNIKDNSCDVTNVRGPVILLAWETINWGYDFESYQAWYLEYNPFAAKTWELY